MSCGIDSFLRRVHRRWMLWRALEHAGIGVVASCAAALALGTILVYRGEPAFGPTIIVLFLGAAIGLAYGLVRRPSLLDAAVKIDRQLKLADLLGTALAISRGETVRADAIDRNWS